MKNYTTPRTLADCEFTTGYSQARSSADAIVVVGSVIAAVALAAIMVIYG